MKKFFSLLAAVLLTTGMAYGQINSGDMIGTVKDQTGAVVPNASITVTSESTGVVTKAQANGSGEYRVSNLLPANYDVSFMAAGFASYTVKGVTISLNKTSTVDAPLTVATSSSTVEVSTIAAVNLDTTSNNLSTTMDQAEFSQLPITSGGFGALNASLLAPNVGSSGGTGVGTGPSVAGNRVRNNNYTIEGIDDNSKGVTGPILIVPPEATGEFTLITGQFSPEFGHSSGGQFNTTIISGTEHYHGMLYENFDNRNLNAENAIQGGKVPNPRYDFNRYGAQVGGPIIPNKLFFFFNYQRAELGQSEQYFLCTPTATGLTTLSSIASAYGFSANNLSQYEKYVPAANYYGGAQVTAANDLACGNQTSGSQYLTVYPGTGYNAATGLFNVSTGNQPTGSTNIPLGNYQVSAPVFSNTDYITSSADFNMSSKDSFRFRYMYLTNGSQDTAAALPIFFLPLPLKEHLGTLSEFHTFTPNLTNEARIGYNRQASITPAGPQTFSGLSSFPNLSFYDQDLLNVGPDPNAPQSTVQNMYQFVDTISYTKGKHQFVVGFDGRKYIAPQTFTQRVRGDYQWDALTEYLHDLGPTYFGQRSSGNFIYYGDQTALYGFANDTYRMTPKLTLNYGVRYEFTSVPTGIRAQALNAGASCSTANPCSGGLNLTFGAPQPQTTNFTPRIGFAYAPDEKTSVRAGFGEAVDVIFDNIGLLSFPPQYSSTTNSDTTATLSNTPCAINSAGVLEGCTGFLAGGGLPAGAGTLNTYPNVNAQRGATSAYLPNQVLPYTETWNLTVQRVVSRNFTAEIQYIGTHGVHLLQQNQINVEAEVTPANQLFTVFNTTGLTPVTNASGTVTGYSEATPTTVNTYSKITAANPTGFIIPAYYNSGFTGKITSYQPYGGSNYNGLGLNLSRRLQGGLQLNTSYTWSKTMDNSTTEVNADALSQRRAQDPRNVAGDYSLSALNHTNRFSFEALYDLPYFKHSNYLLKNIVGNWVVSPVYIYESPEFVTPSSETNSNLDGDSAGISRTITNSAGARGAGTGVLPVYSNTLGCVATGGAGCGTTSLVGYVANSPNAYYVVAGKGTLPTTPRNTLPGRPVDNLDVTLGKKLTFGERFGFEFQAQAFNVLNHAQYVPGSVDDIGTNGTSAANPAYLTPSSGFFNVPGKEWTAHARTMQLAGTFTF
jgi:hypothetical protein